MTSTVGKVVKQAMAKTLEALAFLEVESMDDSSELDDLQTHYQSTIELTSPVKGEATIVMSDKILGAVAKVVFGNSLETETTEPEDEVAKEEQGTSPDSDTKSSCLSDEALSDILGEILNTFAGNLLAEIVPDEKTFRLGFPVTQQGLPENKAGDWYYFKTEDVVFGVIVQILTSE